MKLYNQITKKIDSCELKTDVSTYTCGPTVYDYPHIGNWYTFIRYDLLVRTLRANGHNVNWVMNITDVGHLVSDADSGEDKMEKGAKREGKTAWDVAKFYGDYFIKGTVRLNFSEVTHLPKATDYIEQQINLVKKLEKEEYTYVINDGVYFDTSRFENYAKFAELNLSGQEEGARVEANDEKRNPSDFALWKFSSTNEKRDMEWDSPWGKGFPGWHLECSAMIHELLEEPIDFHAGGIDHIPVHHTNEIAQSEAAFNKTLAKYWMHCNHIQVDGNKMSKSLGNFYTLEDIENNKFSLLVFKLHVLSGHYRSQSEFSWDTLEATKNRLQNWVDKLSLKLQKEIKNNFDLASAKNQLIDVLNNDLNSPQALSIIDTHVNEISSSEVQYYVALMNELFGIDLSDLLKDLENDQLEMLAQRTEARNNKDYQKSDELRLRLESSGLNIFDTADGQFWSRTV